MEGFGLRAQSYAFPEDIGGEEFKREFAAINEDPDVAGILLLIYGGYLFATCFAAQGIIRSRRGE